MANKLIQQPDILSLVDGLYFAGEILDLAGPCGGYNMQWAFSSGFLAGHSAAARLNSKLKGKSS